jgi:hypothetical protein
VGAAASLSRSRYVSDRCTAAGAGFRAGSDDGIDDADATALATGAKVLACGSDAAASAAAPFTAPRLGGESSASRAARALAAALSSLSSTGAAANAAAVPRAGTSRAAALLSLDCDGGEAESPRRLRSLDLERDIEPSVDGRSRLEACTELSLLE